MFLKVYYGVKYADWSYQILYSIFLTGMSSHSESVDPALDQSVSTAEGAPVRNVAKVKPTRHTARSSSKWRAKNTIPDDILNNDALNEAIKYLPSNYNFEIHKCIWKIREAEGSAIALQFPEGLLMYSCTIADIFCKFGGKRVVILGDVTYGACCIDDFTCSKLNLSLLIHYGHSCLVSVHTTKVKVIILIILLYSIFTYIKLILHTYRCYMYSLK